MSVKRIFDLLDYYKKEFPNKEVMFAGKVAGMWETWSFAKCEQLMTDLASGFANLGIERGERVMLMSNNRPEWNIIDFACQLSGIILVPVYPNISENDLQFIINDCEARALIYSSPDLADKANAVQKGAKQQVHLYSIEPVTGVDHWMSLVERGVGNTAEDRIAAVKRETKANDLVTLLYTSGTTGTPKGVMLSHENLVSNFTALKDLPPIDGNSIVLSFLPLNHIYERMLTYLYVMKGSSIYYAESLEKIGENIKEVKPHMFSCVPRLLEKVYDKIITKASELSPIKKALFFWALGLGERYDVREDHRSGWYNFQLKIARKLIFSKWQEALGGNVRAMVSGGAALNPRLARIFWAADIPVLEGYGLTETSPVIAVNTLTPGHTRFGTVGPVISNVQVKIAEDGEILMKGPSLMLGYYKRQDATDEVIDKEGWFHTGDIGHMEEGKYLKITDRKKEIFKTSGGKYIAPQMIENALNSSRFIEQSMVVGENRKFPGAIVVPSFAFVREWAKRHDIAVPSSDAELVKHPKVVERIMEEVDAINKDLAQYERIKQIVLRPSLFSIEGGHLTPKLSLKRKFIVAEHAADIEKMYAGE
jgi:long-chain acyl-CoA synthetase